MVFTVIKHVITNIHRYLSTGTQHSYTSDEVTLCCCIAECVLTLSLL